MEHQCPPHHWVIETANGPVSNGTCACGEDREFQNSIPIKANGKETTVKESKEVIAGRKRDRRETILVPYGLEG